MLATDRESRGDWSIALTTSSKDTTTQHQQENRRMINHNSDFLPESKFTEYYRLNSVPETMSLIEAECFDTPVDTNRYKNQY